MAFIFTPSETIKYSQFSYENFLEHVVQNSDLKELSFIGEWKKYWNEKLHKEDEANRKYIERHSDTNPLIERAKKDPQQYKDRNEMYLYEYSSNHGENFYFHFDIEKVNHFIARYAFKKVTISKESFYIDPDTRYSQVSLDDSRLPFFARMFTIDKTYIVIDGNKRIMSRIEKGIHKFEGYKIPPNFVMKSFFTDLEEWFYTLLYEIEFFSQLMFDGKTSDEIKKYSNAFN